MSPAILSVAALLLVIAVSLSSRINVGILAVASAWLVAVFAAHWKAEALMAVFPSSLFLTLVGVTLLFAVAQRNGTMEGVTRRAVAMCGGHSLLLLPMFFLLACAVSTVGPGAIAATALVAPLAMSVASTAGISVFLAALMVGNGANAGNLSPFSAVGVIVQSMMEQAGLGGHEWNVWAANFTAHAIVSVAAVLLFGGRELLRGGHVHVAAKAEPWTGRHMATLAVSALWILSVVAWRVQPGLSAFAAASVLILGGAADDSAAVMGVPWSVILMVSGVSVLVGVLEKTGGMDLFSTLLAQVSTPRTVNGVIAFLTGVISTYSSTSGVVYPAFLPAVPGLVQKLGGGNPLEVAMSINVGAAMVDVSPLSTIGALCLAALPAGQDPKRLFRQLMAWGFSMAVVGALFCQFGIWIFAR
jgi:di/tricarboxylate transporter